MSTNPKTRMTVKKLCVVALFTAMTIAMSSFGIPVPGGHLYLNDVIICTAALLLDPISAMFVGGVGAFLGDFIFYPTPMFVSLVTHGLQALAISLIFRSSKKHPVISAIGGLLVGAVIMVTGYSLGRAFIYSTPAYAILKLPFQILQALTGVVAAPLLYFKTPLKKLFDKTGADK